MPLEESDVQAIVQKVLSRLGQEAGLAPFRVPDPAGIASGVVCRSVEEAVRRARAAQGQFQELGLEARRKIIEAVRKAGLDHAESLARMAHEETGLGRWEDKVKKNILVSLKTPGVEDLQPVRAYTGDKGLTLIEYAPLGLVASVTPSTNPTSTILNNSISILSAGNAVIFAPHPAAQNCCRQAMRLVDEAILSAGGPAGLVTTVDPAAPETTLALLKSPDIQCALVTGGPAIVKIAVSAGLPRKTICAGPGNPPVIVDESADFAACARGLVDGASFDNCVLCTGEKEVVATAEAIEPLKSALRRDSRAAELTKEQMDALARRVFDLDRLGQDAVLRREFVGKDAGVIARAIGLELPGSARLLWGEVPNDHPFIWIEQLMPVLPLTRVPDFESAVALAGKAEGGNHHTASIYSLRVDRITRAARSLACSIFVKNGPNFMGLGMGEGFASMSIGTPTGDGLTKPTHFSRPLHCSMVGYLRIA